MLSRLGSQYNSLKHIILLGKGPIMMVYLDVKGNSQQ